MIFYIVRLLAVKKFILLVYFSWRKANDYLESNGIMKQVFTCISCRKKFFDDFEKPKGYEVNFSLCPDCGKEFDKLLYRRLN